MKATRDRESSKLGDKQMNINNKCLVKVKMDPQSAQPANRKPLSANT